jgi:hypothetical protein
MMCHPEVQRVAEHGLTAFLDKLGPQDTSIDS